MKTPMQLLLKEVTEARDISVDVNFRSALDFVRDAIEWDYIEKEKEMLAGVWLDAQVAYQGDEYIKPSDPTFDEYYEETFNTK
jgi:hypothetical protein